MKQINIYGKNGTLIRIINVRNDAQLGKDWMLSLEPNAINYR